VRATPGLVLGPLLRYTGESDATVWVETDTACEVEVLGHMASTFEIEGHHYTLVRITDLEPGKTYEYEVSLDGEKVWPDGEHDFPPCVIRTIAPDGGLNLSYGSCRVSVPHEPPFTLAADAHKEGYERDALQALALRMMREAYERWPDALLLLGDQIYADEVSEGALDFIRSRRDTNEPPGEQVADFEEYTRLYWDAWRDPVIRWLLSTLPTAMIFDDHDVNDDWNTSEAWVHQMRSTPWWEERIIGAFMSYWVYQHLGNLSPRELEEDGLFVKVQEAENPTRVLREFAYKADREIAGTRWSYHRDFGRVRLIVMDSRAGRVLKEGHRSMLDEEEWAWIVEMATGDFDHLLFGTSLPFLLGPGLHHLEAASEAVCAGAWGRPAARIGESVRQLVDLEHWSAFHTSFTDLTHLLRSVASGERSNGEPPASVTVLSGDVHHGYLAKMDFDDGFETPVYQSASSPLRNPLGLPERLAMRFGWTERGRHVGEALSRLTGAEESGVRWHLVHKAPWFHNHISSLEIRGRNALLKVEKTIPENNDEPVLYPVLEHRLA
jgi:PhoD-like phosphatase